MSCDLNACPLSGLWYTCSKFLPIECMSTHSIGIPPLVNLNPTYLHTYLYTYVHTYVYIYLDIYFKFMLAKIELVCRAWQSC